MKHFFIYCLFIILLGGCKKRTPANAEMPALTIEVATATTDSIPNRMRFIGYLSSNFDAVIQPRVNGYLRSKNYNDGMPVHRGQLLFTIDPGQLSTTLLAAEAELASARAQAIEARNNYDRAIPLAAINAISQSQLDQYTAQYKAAEAAVRSAEEMRRNADYNVSYTELRSPISGVAEGASAHVGDYVGPGTKFTVLTTVSNLDTVSVNVAIPMAQYLEAVGNKSSIYENAGLLSNIRLILADGSLYPYQGAYNHTQKDVSNQASTLIIVVTFPNPDRALKSGQFARVETNLGVVKPRVVIPQQAVSQQQGITSVWVIKPDQTVEWRQVKTGMTYQSKWCIDEGIASGEQVAITGLQKLHNGMKVKTQRP